MSSLASPRAAASGPLLLLLLLRTAASLLQGLGSGLPHGRYVVCYVGAWATYRPGSGNFSVDHIDPNLCSHIVYAFAGLNESSNSIRSLDPYLDLEENWGKGNYRKVTSLKARYTHLKITLAIGGWNEGSAKYSAMAADPTARKNFAKGVSEFIKKYDFDGLDLDWEYPGKREGKPEDKANFVELIKDLRKELVQGEMLLTAALGASIDTIKTAYDLPQLYKYLDLLHLMCYDYHGNWEAFTGANAPLYATSPMDPLTVEKSVKYLLSNGVKGDKLVVGVPLYGRTFVLQAPSLGRSLGETSIINSGFKGPYTSTDGFLGYNEICLELKQNKWDVHWDNASMTPFAIMENKIISYDDEISLTEKVKFAVDQDLAGIMVWSMDTDDFRGECAKQGDTTNKYPLLNTINKALGDAVAEKEAASRTEKPKEPSAAPAAGPHFLLLVLTPLLRLFL